MNKNFNLLDLWSGVDRIKVEKLIQSKILKSVTRCLVLNESEPTKMVNGSWT